MLVKLGSQVWNVWPLEGRRVGPSPLTPEVDWDGQVLEEPTQESYKEDVITRAESWLTRFPNATQKDFWDFQGLTSVGTLK